MSTSTSCSMRTRVAFSTCVIRRRRKRSPRARRRWRETLSRVPDAIYRERTKKLIRDLYEFAPGGSAAQHPQSTFRDSWTRPGVLHCARDMHPSLLGGNGETVVHALPFVVADHLLVRLEVHAVIAEGELAGLHVEEHRLDRLGRMHQRVEA